MISNTSPNNITIQNLAICDKYNKALPLVSHYAILNSNPDIILPEKYGAFRSYIMQNNERMLLNEISLFKDQPIYLPPYGSVIYTYAVSVTKELPRIPSYFYVTCYTTMTRNKFSQAIRYSLNFISKLTNRTFPFTGEPYYKTYTVKSSKSSHPITR